MRNALIIAGREALASFKTPLAYILMSAFLFLSGFFFFGRLQWFNGMLQQAALYRQVSPTLNGDVITPYLHSIELILVFLLPILSMRALSEEKRQGTFELLITSPLKASQIVWGKFLGLALVLAVMLALSAAFPLGLAVVSNPELAPVLIGILGLFFFALAFLAIGIAVSAFTKNQTISAVISLVVMLVFYVISLPAGKLGAEAASFLNYLAPPFHTAKLYQGVLQSSDVVYFFSVVLLSLFVATRVLESKRWR